MDLVIKFIDYVCLGYIFLLWAKIGGVFCCIGYIEVVIDLVCFVGFELVGVLVEIFNEDGMMACLLEFMKIVECFDFKVIVIKDLVVYWMCNECLIKWELFVFIDI